MLVGVFCPFSLLRRGNKLFGKWSRITVYSGSLYFSLWTLRPYLLKERFASTAVGVNPPCGDAAYKSSFAGITIPLPQTTLHHQKDFAALTLGLFLAVRSIGFFSYLTNIVMLVKWDPHMLISDHGFQTELHQSEVLSWFYLDSAKYLSRLSVRLACFPASDARAQERPFALWYLFTFYRLKIA